MSSCDRVTLAPGAGTATTASTVDTTPEVAAYHIAATATTPPTAPPSIVAVWPLSDVLVSGAPAVVVATVVVGAPVAVSYTHLTLPTILRV